MANVTNIGFSIIPAIETQYCGKHIMPVFIRYNATVLVGASLYHVMKRNKDWLGWRRLRKRHESSRSAGGLRTQNSRGVELIWFGFAWLKWSFKWSVKQRCNEKRLINNFIILPIEIRWIKTYWGLHCACWGNQRTNYLSTLRKEKSTFLFLRKTETKKKSFLQATLCAVSKPASLGVFST